MSSPTVLFIMKRFLEQLKDQKDEYGLATAMGPGFTSEMLMLKWG
jgi:alkylresorcinol/alkylpyrone synthase